MFSAKRILEPFIPSVWVLARDGAFSNQQAHWRLATELQGVNDNANGKGLHATIYKVA